MNSMFKRLLSVVLVLVLVMSCMPMPAAATTGEGVTEPTEAPQETQHEHDIQEEETQAATCGVPGVKTFTCGSEGCNYNETAEIPATGNHTWDAGVETQAPTCTAEGVKTLTCTVCQGTTTEAIPATGAHVYENGACVVCNAGEPNAQPTEEPAEEPTEEPTEAPTEETVVTCDETENCAAETHETTCPLYDWCAALGCTWEVHHADCPWGPCTLTEGCELVKNHPGECTGMDTFDPTGTIGAAYTSASYVGGVPAIYGEATGVVANESFVVKLYSGETLVGTATLVDNDKVLLNGESQTITWHAALTDDGDGWWSTEWTGGSLEVDAIPDKVVLCVDGTEVSTANVQLYISDQKNPIFAAVTDTNGNIQSFVAGTGFLNGTGANAPVYDDALQTALNAGDNIVMLRDITTTAAITTSGANATIDLNGNTLTVGAGDNKFNDATNLTIKNGNIVITGVNVTGNAIFCLDEYEETLVTTVTLDNVNVTGNGYSSAYGIFYIGKSSVLNVNGGTWNLSNDTFEAGGVFKADSAAATLNITGTQMTLHNVRRVVTYADTTISGSNIAISGDADGVDAEMEHGFNRSPLTVTNSTITMENLVGRGITAECGAVNISENSTVTITNAQEATIDVRNGKTVTADSTSTVTVDAAPTITDGTISGIKVLPTGTISSCLVDLSDSAETFIASEITGLNATESVVIKLYSGETQIATTTLKKTEYFTTSPLGVKIIITGESSSWETVWAEGMPRADVIPDKVVLYVDGTEMNSANVPMTSTNGELAVNWAEVPGVNPAPADGTFEVATKAELDAAIATAQDGDTIKLTADIDYTGTVTLVIDKAITLDLGGKTLTTYGTYGGLQLKDNCSLINGTLNHKGTVTAIKAWNVDKIEDVEIIVDFKAEGKTIGGIVIQEGTTNRINSIKNVTITGEGLTNGIETYNCGNATEPVIGSMDNVTIDANGTGMLISAPCGTATNCTITGGTNGIEIWIKGTYSAKLDLLNSTVTGGVFAHDEFSSNPNIENNGTLSLTADEDTTIDDVTLTIARAENVEGILEEVKNNAVAKVGDTYYATLAEAIAAVGAGDVTIDLLEDATLDYNAREAYGTAETTGLTINGNGNTLTLNQKDSDWSSIGLANADAKLVLNNMTIEKIGYGDTSGAWNTHAINFTCPVEMSNVTVNNSMSVENGAALNNVTINEDNGYYGLWIDGNGQTVTVTGGAINATNGGRGIKIADEYVDSPASVTLNVTGTDFNTAKKAAVLVSSTAGAKVTAANVDITNVTEDTTNFVWVDEDWADDFDKVTVTGATAAAENAEEFLIVAYNADGTVHGYFNNLDDLLADSTVDGKQNGKVTVELKDNVATSNEVKTSSLKHYNFVTNVEGGVEMNLDYADDWNYFRYVDIGEGVTVNAKYLVFSYESNIAGTVDAYYPYINGAEVTVTETGVLKYAGGDGLQVKAGATLTVNGTVEAPTVNVWSGDAKLIVSGEKAKLTADWIDIWDGTPSVTIENGATIEAKAIKASRGGTITIDGATLVTDKLELGHNGESDGHLTVTNNGTVNGETTLTALGSTVTGPEGMNVTSGVEGYKVVYADGVYRIVEIYAAQIGDVKYKTLDAALTAAKDGDTIEVSDDAADGTYTIPEDVAISVNGNKVKAASGEMTMKLEDGKATFTIPAESGEYLGKAYVNDQFIYITKDEDDTSVTVTVNEDKTLDYSGTRIESDDFELPAYVITDIDGSKTQTNVHFYGSKATMTFYCNGPLELFDHAYVTDEDNKVVWIMSEPEDYTVKPDGTVLTMTNRFLKKLPVGKYTMHMVYKHQDDPATVTLVEATNNFYVKRATPTYDADPSNPKTGDAIMLPAAMMLFSAAALAVLLLGKKKYA